MCTCQSQSPNSSHHHPTPCYFPPLVSIRLFSTSVSLFLPCKLVHLYHFSRFHIYALIYDICFYLSDLLHSVWQSLDPSMSLPWPNFVPSYGWVIFHCIYVPHLFLKINLFILFYLFIFAVLGLHCCALAFSSCGEQGPLFVVVRGPLIAVASLAEHRL